ncbi:peptidase S8 and S53 subtilisin kexin sedolisin [Anaeromyxobacter sp. K]|uniref:S8 family serine peptidase n=1 Tax=Anaeromyxobacter sp. (strain K) TaxID=447217 RepID=UPI00015F9B11|nr:S8 family serine peptidase [Anaeromyxobacter sp. K]ACG71487.1 peptidase S8 and S53 subtilisin kexin sedolisin [Anaeromyxobacter sp. K]
MTRLRTPAALALSLAALACGGGGSDSPPLPTTFTLSGHIAATAGQDVDGDVADPVAPKTPNDTRDEAQQLAPVTTLGGFADAGTDPQDWYRATLEAGQTVVMDVADTAASFELCLLASDGATVNCATAGANQVIPVAAAGQYYLRVTAAAGVSNYALTLGVNGAAASAGAAPHLALPFVPGEIVVRFRDDALGVASAGDLPQRAAALGLTALAGARGRAALLSMSGPEARARALAALGVEPLAPDALGAGADPVLAEKWDTLRAIAALRRRADVESADPNFVFQPARVPTDTYYKYQWHYPLISLPQAWDVTRGATEAGTAAIVAVVDTGVFLAHPDLSGQLVTGYDFIRDPTMANDGNGIDPNPDDPGDAATPGGSSWHGTHVAGTVAAKADGSGVVGVAWDARVMPLRALGVGGGTSYDIVQAVSYAAGLANDSGTVPATRAAVVNLSLGCQGCFSSTEQAVYTAARNAGVIVVAAAGNEASSAPGYPAAYAGVLSVSAVDMKGAKAPYSNTGSTVDLAAPGGNTAVDLDGNGYADGVLSTLVKDTTGTREPIYAFYQGTSMAAPHVAGVMALMKSVCPSLAPAAIDQLLQAGQLTRDLGPAGRDDTFGWGLVDALKAVQAAATSCGAPLPPSLSVTPGRLDFGPADATLQLQAAKVGEGALTVTAVSDDATWLTVTAPGVDASGLGAYAAAVDRTGLADGRYAAKITFTPSVGDPVVIPVTLQVGAAAAAGDAGYLYALLVREGVSGPELVKQWSGAASGGSYAFRFDGVSAGTYYLVAGSDMNNDGYICDAGESCGAWPTLGVLTPLGASGPRSDLDFSVAFDPAVAPVGAAAGAPVGVRGLARQPATKGVAGLRERQAGAFPGPGGVASGAARGDVP